MLFALHLPSLSSAVSEGWILISQPGDMPGFYYDPLSVQQVRSGFVSVTTLINAVSDEDIPESLLGNTLYNCDKKIKQEQSAQLHSGHWLSGDIQFKSGREGPWTAVKVGTDGMRLLEIVCQPPR